MDPAATAQQTAEVIDIRQHVRAPKPSADRATVSLTERSVAALAYSRANGQPQFNWDSKMIGLGVRITAAGAKSYVLRYRVHGRQRLITFGDTRVHSLDAIRKKARLWLAQADNGVDPQVAQEHLKQIGTLNDAWECYLSERIIHRSKRSQVELRQL